LGVIDKEEHRVYTQVKARLNDGSYASIDSGNKELVKELYYKEKLTKEQIEEMAKYYAKNMQYIKL
jgi:hypothetical protein